MTHSNSFVVINQCTFILNPILTNWHHRKQDSEAHIPCISHPSPPIIPHIMGYYWCCHCTIDSTKDPLGGVTSAVVDTTFVDIFVDISVDIYVDTKNIPTCRYNIQHIDKRTMENKMSIIMWEAAMSYATTFK